MELLQLRTRNIAFTDRLAFGLYFPVRTLFRAPGSTALGTTDHLVIRLEIDLPLVFTIGYDSHGIYGSKGSFASLNESLGPAAYFSSGISQAQRNALFGLSGP
ncbi:carbonic anhydrase [Striga asiatica]|uniref:Carbonic anhydrase n=1 Tax=Striga asiatica TaxID=4170 RepID=A0A5A7QU56_STRAF|nr:carbonic anhydrase [Striga asiatica]